MRRMIAFAIVLAISVPVLPLVAAGPVAGRQAEGTGTIKGVAKNAKGEPLPKHTVRCRDTQNNEISATTTSDASGEYTLTVPGRPRACVVELVDTATGMVIGTSTAVTVAAGAAATVGVTASAAAAVGVAAAATGGAFLATTAGIVTATAVGLGVAGVAYAASRPNSSGSQ